MYLKLGSTLYLLYTSDIPTTEDTMIGTFADDIVVLANGIDFDEVVVKTLRALDGLTWSYMDTKMENRIERG